MSGRSRSIRPDRRYALLALYQFDSGLAGDLAAVRAALESVDELGDDGEGADLSTAAARLEARAPERIAARREEIEAGLSLASMVWEFRNDADKAVRPFTAEWPVHRQPVIDRNALRLGWYGFTHAGDPVAVAIDESVELAKTFSTEKSGAFVNAVLDRVAKSGASEKAQ
ncbi:MAG: transcription antitermination protein NusB [bacterium]